MPARRARTHTSAAFPVIVPGLRELRKAGGFRVPPAPLPLPSPPAADRNRGSAEPYPVSATGSCGPKAKRSNIGSRYRASRPTRARHGRHSTPAPTLHSRQRLPTVSFDVPGNTGERDVSQRRARRHAAAPTHAVERPPPRPPPSGLITPPRCGGDPPSERRSAAHSSWIGCPVTAAVAEIESRPCPREVAAMASRQILDQSAAATRRVLGRAWRHVI